jgi:hypothetical protein
MDPVVDHYSALCRTSTYGRIAAKLPRELRDIVYAHLVDYKNRSFYIAHRPASTCEGGNEELPYAAFFDLDRAKFRHGFFNGTTYYSDPRIMGEDVSRDP